MNSRKRKISRPGRFPGLLCLFAVGGLLLGAQAAIAQVTLSGGTTEGPICMQRVFMGPTAVVSNANQLNCTASDVKIAKAISAINLDTGTDTCAPNTTFRLRATFQVNVTASIRYDEGFFFRVDGTGFARGDGTGATGQCSLSWLEPTASPGDDLDGGDGCGDLTSGSYTNVTFEIPNVSCTDNGNGRVRLPNCVSWHNNQGTACSPPPPNSNDFTFNPDTKSKCTCDDTFSIPIFIEFAKITVVKTASPTEEPETGGTVTYTVKVTNDATVVDLTINSITDDLYGNLGTDTPPRANNTCPGKIGTVLAPGAFTTCSFDAFVSGNKGDTVTDIAEVCGTDSQGHGNLCAHDDAVVLITDSFTAPTVAKTAQSTANCQLDATYLVVVSNNSSIDSLTVNSLNDDKFGSITAAHAAGGGFAAVLSTTCNTAPTTVIAASGNYNCTFVGRIVSASCSINHTNTVTANLTDSDGVASAPTDDATVTVTATP